MAPVGVPTPGWSTAAGLREAFSRDGQGPAAIAWRLACRGARNESAVTTGRKSRLRAAPLGLEQRRRTEVLTVKQTADQLQVSAALVYQLCAGRKLAHHRLGVGRGTIRIAEADLAAFVEDCKVLPYTLANVAGLRHLTMPSAG